MMLYLDNANAHEYPEHDNKPINGIRADVSKACHSYSPNRAEQNRLKALEKLKNKKPLFQSSSTIPIQLGPGGSKGKLNVIGKNLNRNLLGPCIIPGLIVFCMSNFCFHLRHMKFIEM